MDESEIARVVRESDLAGRAKLEGKQTVRLDRDLRDEVLEIVDGLPFESARVLWFVDVCECTYLETARATDTSAEQIALRIHSIRRHIRRRVEPTKPVIEPSIDDSEVRVRGLSWSLALSVGRLRRWTDEVTSAGRERGV